MKQKPARQELWKKVEERLRLRDIASISEETAIESHGIGKPQIVLPRLGQGSFRILVIEAYERKLTDLSTPLH
jgi:putative restriction endonuclease